MIFKITNLITTFIMQTSSLKNEKSLPVDFLPYAQLLIIRTVLLGNEKSFELLKKYSAVVEYRARQFLKRT